MELEKNIRNKIKETLKKIHLSKNKKLLVALSGGKDSATTLYFLNKFGYSVEGLHIDLGMGDYSKNCKSAVIELCSNLGVPLHVYDIKKEMGSSMCYIRTTIQSKQVKGEIKNCAICGVIKKWILNKKARELGFEFIATGHNLDDELQTFLINVFKGSPNLSFNSGAITKNIQDKKFVNRVKPLFYVTEDDIRKFTKAKKLPVVYSSCPCLIDSYRKSVREWINKEISKKEKEIAFKNFEKIFSLKKSVASKINYCEICEEPCRDKICKKCSLFTLK